MSDAENTGAPVETVKMALPTDGEQPANDEAAAPGSFNPVKRYEVTFARVVEMSPFRYTPRDGKILMRGGVLNRIVKEKGADVLRTAIER